jgi:hypothetical protein
MRGILADINFDGILTVLVRVWSSDYERTISAAPAGSTSPDAWDSLILGAPPARATHTAPWE